MEVLVRPHILSNRNRRVEDIDYGMSIAEVVWRLPGVDERLKKQNLAVMIDGVVIPRTEWNDRKLTREDGKVEIAAVLHGGGRGGSKQILALVATVLLAAVSGPAAGALTGTGGILAGVSPVLVKAGIVLVGTLAINAIFAPPKANNSPEDRSQAYSLSGQSNQARRYGRLPRVYGRHRVVPDLAAVPYTVNSGNESYLYVIYSFGYGPLDLEDFRIGENPLNNYRDVDIVVHENFTSSSQLELYRSDVWQQPLSFDLKVATGAVTFNTEDECDRATIDMTFPSGLGVVDAEEGETYNRLASMQVEYRAFGSGSSYSKANIVSVVRGRNPSRIRNMVRATGSGFDIIDSSEGYWVKRGLAKGRTTFDVIGRWTADRLWIGDPGTPGSGAAPTAGKSIRIGPYTLTVASHVGNTLTTTTGLPQAVVAANESTGIEVYYTETDPALLGKWELQEHTQVPFNSSCTITFPSKGQWQIRITKLDADSSDSDTTQLWRRYITAIKSFKNEPPIVPEVPMSIVELRIRASGQLNGNIEQFNAIATSKLRVWDEGTSSWVVEPTRNPAWVYLDILTGTANPKPIADTRIDMDRLKDWAVRCDTIDAGFNQVLGTCDVVIDRTYTIWELLQSVATTGRAAPHMRDNLYSVIIDDATRVPVQMFTPRNSANLSSTRTYVREPHALRVRWVDPAQSYGPAEIIVYNTGYTIANAVEFEDLNSFGMTRPEQVTRWGRYMLAQGKLRQERFTLDVDIENIVCTRGDLVLVAHDVIEVGGEAARIAEIDGNFLYLDSPPTLDSSLLASAAGVRVRSAAGELTSVLDVTSYSVDMVEPYVELADPPPPNIAVGDLLVFGEKTSVTAEYVVDFIRPKNELSATIGLEEYAPAVYDAESTGVIPDYVPPGNVPHEAPPVSNLTASLLQFYDSEQAPRGFVQLSWSPQQGTMFRANYYRVFDLLDDGTEVYLGETVGYSFRVADGDGQAFRLRNLTDFTKVYRVVAFYETRGMSPPMDVEYEFVVEATLPPPPVDTFAVSDLPNERRRYAWGWTDGQPSTVVGVRIRYIAGDIATPDWDLMTEVGTGEPLLQTGMEVATPLGAGTYTFLCRAVDQYGVMSTEVRTTAELEITTGKDLTAPPAPTGVVVTGGVNVLFFEHDTPSFTMGGGYAFTQVYAAKYSGAGPLPEFTDAVPFSTFSASFGTAGAEPAATYHVWMALVSKDGAYSTVAGGTNGFTATTTLDADAIIDVLDGVGKPFLVLDVDTEINGVVVPAGVYIRDAAIHEATIGTAHIQDAAITDAKIDTLNAAKIIAGTITTDKLVANAATVIAESVHASEFSVDWSTLALTGVGRRLENNTVIEITTTGAPLTIHAVFVGFRLVPTTILNISARFYIRIDGVNVVDPGDSLANAQHTAPTVPNTGSNRRSDVTLAALWRDVSLPAGTYDIGFQIDHFFYNSTSSTSIATESLFYTVYFLATENKV